MPDRDVVLTMESALRQDSGWQNVINGLNIVGRDSSASTSFALTNILQQQQLDDIYRGDGLGRKIIDLPSEEMTREWLEIQGDSEGEILDELDRLDAKAKVTDLIRFSKLYGGAVMVMVIDDGLPWEEPLFEKGIRSIVSLQVYDRYEVDFTDSDLYDDPLDPQFGQPRFYQISPINQTPFIIHESRVIRMDGAPLPMRASAQNNYWGDSILQYVYNDLRRVGDAMGSSKKIIDDFVQAVLKIKRLADMIAQGKADLVMKRVDLINISRAVGSLAILDEEENYEKHTTTVSGVADLLDRYIKMLSASTNIPVTLLMGQSPAGLNATGDNDVRNWYDHVKSDQEDEATPVINRLSEIIQLAKDGPFRGAMLSDWSVSWLPLWQPTQEEIAQTHKTQAEADKIYIEAGVLSPVSVAKSRFGGDHYSLETEIEEADLVEARELELEAAREEGRVEGVAEGMRNNQGNDDE